MQTDQASPTPQRSPATRWLLWLTLLHTLPAPFWLYVVAGTVPAAGLLGAGTISLFLGDRQSLMMGAVLGGMGLVWAVVFYLLAWLLEFLLRRIRRALLRSLLLLALVVAAFLLGLAPIYVIGGHGGSEQMGLPGLLTGFVKNPALLHAYAAGLFLLLSGLWVLQAIRLPPFLQAVQRRAPPTYIMILLLTGVIAFSAVYAQRIALICMPAGEAGMTWGQLCVARHLRDRPGHSGRQDAINWYERAAQQGSRTAIRELMALQPGNDVLRKWLPKLAADGDPEARLRWWQLVTGDRQASAEEKQTARTWLNEAAGSGHAGAAVTLGRLLVKEEPAAARKLWEQAAEHDDGDALRELAWRYAAGVPGFPINLRRAADYNERLAAGVEAKQFDTGMHSLSAAGYRQQAAAIRSLLQEAESGRTGAQLKLASRLLESANPGAAGRTEAISLLEKAAGQGDVTAQHELGKLFIFGRKGVEKDLPRGRNWWNLAAAQNHVPTLRYVAEARISGKYGYPLDLGAARSGFTVLVEAFTYGRHGVAANERNAAYWQSALRDTERRIARLGPDYQPIGILRKQADAGDADAQYRLGLQLLESYSPDARAEALQWWIRAAAAGDHRAQFRLVSYYDRGHPALAKNHARVRELLQQAAAGRHAQGLYTLGLAYEKGRYGFKRDLDLAGEIYRDFLNGDVVFHDGDDQDRLTGMVRGRAKAVDRMLEFRNRSKPDG